jgi:hypothetical protein
VLLALLGLPTTLTPPCASSILCPSWPEPCRLQPRVRELRGHRRLPARLAQRHCRGRTDRLHWHSRLGHDASIFMKASITSVRDGPEIIRRHECWRGEPTRSFEGFAGNRRQGLINPSGRPLPQPLSVSRGCSIGSSQEPTIPSSGVPAVNRPTLPSEREIPSTSVAMSLTPRSLPSRYRQCQNYLATSCQESRLRSTKHPQIHARRRHY